MSHVRRRASTCLFFTLSLASRGSDALIRNVDALRQAVRQTKAERPFHIRAMVILPDHLHAIWTLPDCDSDYLARWTMIEARFSQALRDSARPNDGLNLCEYGLWQDQLREHHVHSDAEKRHLTQACWLDPVRHGLVTDPFDWAHSSIHRDAIRGVNLDQTTSGLGHAFLHQAPVTDALDKGAAKPV